MKKYSIPKGIEKEAAEYIQGVLAELENRGVLENIDNAALDMLARNYSTFIKASKQLEIIKNDYYNLPNFKEMVYGLVNDYRNIGYSSEAVD